MVWQTTKDDTDAEIERIKAEIETEQKSKETIGKKLSHLWPGVKILKCRMDQHGVGEDGPNDGEECGGHGGRQP